MNSVTLLIFVLRLIVFKKRDAEGRFMINTVLLHGHEPMLKYILDYWLEAN